MNPNLELVPFVEDETPQLVLYDRMRLSVKECARIDEAKEIRDQAAALQHYAKQRDDAEVELWMSEIRLRAIQRIGEISRELEKMERARTDLKEHTDRQTKTEQLNEAGLSLRLANQYEQLAAPTPEQVPTFSSALDHYIEEVKEKKGKITFSDAVKAIRQSLIDSGKLKEKPKDNNPKQRDLSWIRFSDAVHVLADERAWNWNLICKHMKHEVLAAQSAIDVLKRYISEIEVRSLHIDGISA